MEGGREWGGSGRGTGLSVEEVCDTEGGTEEAALGAGKGRAGVNPVSADRRTPNHTRRLPGERNVLVGVRARVGMGVN